MQSPRKARLAVIGTGWWATYTHIPAILAHPDADLVALCDANPERLQTAARHFHISRTYTDVADLLAHETLDGAVIAVNHTAHYPVARACLEAGLHVLIEKPMVLEARHARDLEALARERRREIIVGYPWHYTATARRAREVIASGRLGPVQFVASLFASMVVEFYRGRPEAYQPVFQYPVTGPTPQSYRDVRLAGGGQGHLQVTHSAGLLLWTTGLQPETVSAFMANFDVPVDLVDAISVRFAEGALGTVGSTGNIGVGDSGQHELRIYCAEGYCLLDMVAGTLTIREHSGATETLGPLPPEERYPRFAPVQNLIAVILGRAPNHSPGEVGRRCVELLDAAYRSAAREGQPVRVADL